MSGPIPIAFHAPLKAPDHPVPSGDRTMARLMVKALQRAGFSPRLASSFRSFEGEGNPARQEALRNEALAEADRIIPYLRDATMRPKLWFSYHVYYKAPDWIGPKVAKALDIPYVIAEGSRAMKRANGPWAIGHRGAEQALDHAAVVFAMTAADSEALRIHKPDAQKVLSLPPFIDLDEWPEVQKTARNPHDPMRLLTVAMMRKGDKLASFQQLANALHGVTEPWQLDIIGDGPARAEVEAYFAPFGSKVTFHGEIGNREQLAAFYAHADLLVWPAVNEAYGMVFLEAQAQGCPVLAGNHGGVASVVRDGETGILTQKNAPEALARALSKLATAPTERLRLAGNARRFVRGERTLETAALQMREALLPLLAGNTP